MGQTVCWALFQNRNRQFFLNTKKNFHNTSDTIFICMCIEAYRIGGVKRLWSFMKWPHDELSVFICSSIGFDVDMRIFIMLFKRSNWMRFNLFRFLCHLPPHDLNRIIQIHHCQSKELNHRRKKMFMWKAFIENNYF